MTDGHLIVGEAAPLDIANLDTDQIMPKQFLRGIDKKGLDKGLLWDLRFDRDGKIRSQFVLNRPEYANTTILIAGPNFGCGSSREHAVWGLQQYGIKAVIASSFGEIFYSNSINNGLVVVVLPPDIITELLKDASDRITPFKLEIDLKVCVINVSKRSLPFKMSDRHRKMFIDGVDMIDASLAYESAITAFTKSYWSEQPWVKDVAVRTKQRLVQY